MDILELHILQNFVPSILNRDESGNPKDTYFGGVKRGRISSQCQKSSQRNYMRDNHLLDPNNLALRTKRLIDKLAECLQLKNHTDIDENRDVISKTLGGFGWKKNKKKPLEMEYLLFLGNKEIELLVEQIDKNWDILKKVEEKKDDDETDSQKKSKKQEKQDAKNLIPDEIKKNLNKIFDGGKAVDLALFGRMIADSPAFNKDAACQVAHAISTHKVADDFDFFTAVDDLKPSEESGSAYLEPQGFNSCCYYRYMNIDLNKFLKENLQNDCELAVDGLRAFIKAAYAAVPTGKINAMAHYNQPSYVICMIRRDTDPRNLANAFEKPVFATREKSIVEASIEKLNDEINKQKDINGMNIGDVYITLDATQKEPVLNASRIDKQNKAGKITFPENNNGLLQKLIDTAVAMAYPDKEV